MEYAKKEWMEIIDMSFIGKKNKAEFKDLIKERFSRLK